MDHGRRTPKHYIGAACAVVLIAGGTATAAVSGSSSSTDYSGAIAAGTTLSGVVEIPTATGGARQGALNFGIWRGKAIQSVTGYLGASTWASMTGVTAQGQTQYFANTGAHISWSIPLIPADGSDTLANAATGADDANYKSIAQQLVAGGESTATLRLGWETGGNWFAWSGYQDPTDYVAAFQHAVTAMRSVAGQHFTFDWDYALHTTDPTLMYPGDAYVDYISADVYDESWASSFPPTDHVNVWNQIATQQWGLNWLATFGAAHGKRLAIPEWGVNYRCDGHGGGDDPYFVQSMKSWIASHDVAYEDYFNGDNSSCEKYAIENGVATTATFPTTATAYLSSFGTGSSTAPASTAPTTAAPTTAAPTTAAPTTAAPTTAAPTTAAPTTAAPTTAAPTTAAPSSTGTTTSAPASATPVTTAPVSSSAPVVVPSAPVPAAGVNTHHIDFGAQTSSAATGYTLDYGQPFSTTTGFGWEDNTTGLPTSLVGNGRERDSAASIDQRYDTLVQMQQTSASTVGVQTPGRWELAVANGTYNVTVGVGDPTATNSVDAITAERGTANQTTIINNFVPTTATPFQTVTKTVTVSDGRLTLDPTGGTNTKLDFVDVVPVPDTTAPVSTITLAGQQDITATVTSSDNAGGSGVASTTYSLDGGPATPYTTPIVVTADGSHTLVVTTTDIAGNASTATKTWTELHDTTAPTAAITLAGQQDITATVTAADNPGGSGLASTTYTLDGGPATPYTAPVTVTTDGAHTLVVTATDNYGNTSTTTKTWTELHDTTAPTAAITLTGQQDITATVTAADNPGGSGLASTTYSLDGGPATPYTAPVTVTTDGAHTLVVTATDNYGNTSTTTQTWTELHDTTAPTAVVTLAGAQDMHGTYTTDVAATIIAADNIGGIGLASTTYSLDGAPAVPYTTPVTVTGDGNHTLVVTATDAYGNSSTTTQTWTELHPFVDTIAPVVAATLAGNQDVRGTYTTNVSASVAASDNVGVTALTVSLDGAAPTPYTGPITVTADGNHSLVVSASDAAGNVTTTTTTWAEQHPVAVVAPLVVVPSAPATSGLLRVSASSNRSLPVDLNGATLRGSEYIFADVPVSDLQVAFSLDGKAYSNEYTAPWDLAGTSATGALPLVTSSLASGTHTLTATSMSSTGVLTQTSATFTIVTPATSPLRVSLNADRSAPFNVDGARLTGTVYVFDVPTAPALLVNFLVDGKPVHLEVTAPYDLGSSGPVNALPVNISQLAKGTHTLSTVTMLMSGATQTVKSTFTVV